LKKILIIGVDRGIGKYLSEVFDCVTMSRTTEKNVLYGWKKKGFDVIIHCAFNSKKQPDYTEMNGYLEDNVLLTQKLIEIPCKKFIFFSSVDIYPNNKAVNLETDHIDVLKIDGIYAVTKLISERLIQSFLDNYLILRPTSLLGCYMRKNTTRKIVEDKDPQVGLAKDSRFNYVLYKDIAEFLKTAIRKDIKGIFNVASKGSIVLSDVSKLVSKKVKYGKACYKVPNVSNKKLVKICPVFERSSKDSLVEFIRETNGEN